MTHPTTVETPAGPDGALHIFPLSGGGSVRDVGPGPDPPWMFGKKPLPEGDQRLLRKLRAGRQHSHGLMLEPSAALSTGPGHRRTPRLRASISICACGPEFHLHDTKGGKKQKKKLRHDAADDLSAPGILRIRRLRARSSDRRRSVISNLIYSHRNMFVCSKQTNEREEVAVVTAEAFRKRLTSSRSVTFKCELDLTPSQWSVILTGIRRPSGVRGSFGKPCGARAAHAEASAA